jgi:hypothetical protein
MTNFTTTEHKVATMEEGVLPIDPDSNVPVGYAVVPSIPQGTPHDR